MMHRLVLVIGLIAPNVLLSQARLVLTGDHPGYTRIVLPHKTSEAWTIQEIDEGYLFQSDTMADLDLTQAFRRIGRNRIDSIDKTDQGLSISLACDCFAEWFPYQRNFIVIDIKSSAGSREPVRNDTQLIAETLIESARQMRNDSTLTGFQLPLVYGMQPLTLSRSGRDAAIDDMSNKNAQDIEQKISEIIAKGTGEGLLTPSDVSLSRLLPLNNGGLDPRHLISTANNGTRTSGLVADQFENVGQNIKIEDINTLMPGLLARTGYSTTPQLNVQKDAEEKPPVSCATPESLDFLAGKKDDELEPYNAYIGELEKAVSISWEQVEPEVVLNLAKGYMHFGLGSETIQSLEIDGQRTRERQLIRGLAEVISHIPQSTDILESQAQCQNFASLWALAVSSEYIEPDASRLSEYALSFNGLSKPLQDILRPIIKAKIVHIQSKGNGKQNQDSQGEDVMLEKLLDVFTNKDNRLIMESQETQTDSWLLRSPSPRADLQKLVEYIDRVMKQDETIPQNALEILDTFELEYRGRQQGDDLLRLRVNALIQNEDLNSAISALNDKGLTLDSVEAQQLKRRFIEKLEAHSDDMVFLDIVAKLDSRDFQDVNLDGVMARLSLLGFESQDVKLEVMEPSEN